MYLFLGTLVVETRMWYTGSSDEDVLIALRCLDVVISKRRRQVSAQRILAFTKRLCTVALQLSAHGALGVLAIVNNIMQVSEGYLGE